MPKFLTGFFNPFSLDVRSLAVARVCLGGLLLTDLFTRISYFRAHYTDWGVLPRSALIEQFSHADAWSLHFFSGSSMGMSLIFGLATICYVNFLLGYKTRWFNFLSWLLLCSLQNRNPMILNGGDAYLRLLVFWTLFLPTGARYSVDCFLSGQKTVSKTIFDPGSVALTCQILMVYGFTFLLKSGEEWWPEGSAGILALNLDMFVTDFGEFLKGFPSLVRAGTLATWIGEGLAPFLLIIPLASIRLLVLLALFLMHLGFELSLEIGFFSFIAWAALLPLLPSAFWDQLEGRRSHATVMIYFDDGCLFCRKMARILAGFLGYSHQQIRPARADSVIQEIMERENSWVVTVGSTRFLRYSALVEVLRGSPYCGALFRHIPLTACQNIGTRAYIWIASNRSFLSKLFKSWPREDVLPQIAANPLAKTVCYVSLGIAFTWNLTTLPQYPFALHPAVESFAVTLRLDQKWNMFSPYPLKDDGWYVISGELDDGSPVDVYQQRLGKPSFEKPTDVSDTYKYSRWRKYLSNLWNSKFASHRLYYGRYLCRRWTENMGSKLYKFSIHFMLEKTTTDGHIPAQKMTIWNHLCYQKETDKA